MPNERPFYPSRFSASAKRSSRVAGIYSVTGEDGFDGVGETGSSMWN